MRPALARLFAPELRELTSYVPHGGSFPVRLDANEAPAVLSTEAAERLLQSVGKLALERYPDALAAELRGAIAAHMQVTPEEVLVGVGSDEVVAMLLTALRRPRDRSESATVLTTTPSFVMYRISARARGMRVVEVPLDDEWDLATESMLRAIEFAPPNVVFIASPNNPTSGLASLDRVEAVIRAAQDAIVVIDEAYVDYADRDAMSSYREHDNVVILRTLSKTGFAGLRVGWLVARPELVRELDKVRQPYNLPSPSQALATAVLRQHWPDVQASIARVRAERERMATRIRELPGFAVTSSQANFLWLRTPSEAGPLFEALQQQGVLVRSFHGRGGRLARQLRVTVGRASDNDAFLHALAKVSAR